jgi:hypothetical protein
METSIREKQQQNYYDVKDDEMGRACSTNGGGLVWTRSIWLRIGTAGGLL